MSLTATGLTLAYGNRTVIKDVCLQIDPSQITIIIGPNGSGKSTLLTALAGQRAAESGEVKLNQKDIEQWPRRELAKALALLPQNPQAPEDILVHQMVALGRFAHRKPFRPLTPQDLEHIDRALVQTETSAFRDRPVAALSGGQRQRVWIAMALAQAPDMLLLDEPTSFLDMGFQHQVLDLLTRLNRDDGLGLVMVLHDINQASFYADRLIALDQGGVVADGAPEEVVKSALIEQLYGLPVAIQRSEKTARPYCMPAHL